MTSDVIGVLHLAAVSRVLWCVENKIDCEDVNVRGTETVMDIVGQNNIPWFVFASTREIYGIAKEFPVTEETPANAANAYGGSKARAEEVIHRHIDNRNEKSLSPLHAIALRLSNVYGGPADHVDRLIPSIMTNALANRPIQISGGDQDVSRSIAPGDSDSS